jgi:hypothetical protein
MRKHTILTTFLAIALLTTNGWWAYKGFGVAIGSAYKDRLHRKRANTLTQVLQVVPVACSKNRNEIISAAMLKGYKSEPYTKDGYTWVANIGLAFGPTGQLIEVVPSKFRY